MKILKTLGLTALLGLSSFAFAETANTPNATQNDVQAVSSVTQSAATVASNPNVVNINTASAAELQDKLVSIGAKKAQAIVDYRTKHGNFTSIEQLSEVSGIGEGILKQNRDRIVLE